MINTDILKIDLSKDYAHVVHLASKNSMTAELLGKKIQQVQKLHKQRIWENLCKEKPVLAEYEKIVQQCAKTQGYRKEQIQKTLQILATHITNDSFLLNQLERDLPNIAKKILSKAQSQLDHVRTY